MSGAYVKSKLYSHEMGAEELRDAGLVYSALNHVRY